MYNIIIAVEKKFGIGKNNILPWKSTNDLKHFASTTAHSVLIFGHNTWFNLIESIQSKILKNRHVIVITRKTQENNKIHAVTSFNNALVLAKEVYENTNVFVCGGAKVYNEALKHNDLNKIILTLMKGTYDCDKHVPSVKMFIENNCNVDSMSTYDDCIIITYNVVCD